MIQTLPMTAGQQGLWYLSRTGDDACAAYNVVLALRTSAPLVSETLARAMNRVLQRHPLLAARVVVEDFLPRLACDPALRAPVQLRAGTLEHVASAESGTPIDLAVGPLYRIALVDGQGDGEGTGDAGPGPGLVLTVHHLVFDGASAGVLLDELARSYGAADAPAPVAAAWAIEAHVERERQFLQGAYGGAQLDVLVDALVDLPAGDPLETVAAADAQATPPAGQCVVALPAGLAQSVRALAARSGTTPAAVYLAALLALAWQYGRRTALAVSLPVDLRDEASAGAVGYLVNMGMLRADLDPRAPVGELLDQVGDRLFDMLAARAVPFPALVRRLKGRRDDLVGSLMRLAFNYQWAVRDRWCFDAIEAYAVPVAPRLAKALLKLEVEDAEHGARCIFDFDAQALEATVVRRMSTHYAALLREIVEAPERPLRELAVLDAAERRALLGAPIEALPASAVERRVEAQARARPDAPAVVCGAQHLSYGELDARAERLAARLRAGGVGPDVRVAMCLGRCVDRPVAMLAIAKAGGACLPLDPEAPDTRLRGLLEDSDVGLVLCHADARARFAGTPAPVVAIDAPDATAPVSSGPAALPGHLAYCIYTSGSTGRPKGVDVPRSALAQFVEWHLRTFGTGPGDRVMHLNNIAFDPATWEIWSTLCAGATLVMLEELVIDPHELARRMLTLGISSVSLPTPLMESFISAGAPVGAQMRWLHTGGDQLRRSLPDERAVLVNHYGPTECTITATVAYVPAGHVGAASIGRPLAHMRTYVLDERLALLPPGVAGELYIAGEGVARGYSGHPALTAERFLPDPFGPPGSRMYRSGDVVRWRADGELNFIGRADRQIKLRGYRIEPGEVEVALMRITGVREAAVGVQEDERGERHLVAHVAPLPGAEGGPDNAVLAQALALGLPAYMVPVAFVRLPALPKGAGGKVARAALPPAPLRQAGADAPEAAPASPTEQWLAAIWREVLALERIGRDDNFFALGGHSLIATKIVARVSTHLARPVALRLLLDHPTVATLAHQIDALPATAIAARVDPPRIVRRARATDAPA